MVLVAAVSNFCGAATKIMQMLCDITSITSGKGNVSNSAFSDKKASPVNSNCIPIHITPRALSTRS
jgi:hypothetical protein